MEIKDNKEIKFWDHRKENGWLSNFWEAPIEYNDLTYPTSEHLYQALKTNHSQLYPKYATQLHDIIRKASSAKEAKNLAHSHRLGATLKENVNNMRLAIGLKFDQHPELKEKLVNSVGLIIEASITDDVWGIGKNGDGLNLMGLLLMELRTKLQNGQK